MIAVLKNLYIKKLLKLVKEYYNTAHKIIEKKPLSLKPDI